MYQQKENCPAFSMHVQVRCPYIKLPLSLNCPWSTNKVGTETRFHYLEEYYWTITETPRAW